MSDVRVAWVVVTYGNAGEAKSLIDSVGATVGVRFIVVGNKPGDAAALRQLLADRSDVQVVACEHNPGYMGALAEVADRLELDEWVILSNSDLIADPNFVLALRRVASAESVAMVAPAIIGSDGQDQNPNLLKPPSAKKLRALERLHHWNWIANAVGLLRRRGHSSRTVHGAFAGDEIFAGHGSCLIFSPQYRGRGGRWDYPCRLFGEELWCASEVARMGLKWVYVPNVQVVHREHSTTGSGRRRGAVAQWKHESLRFWASIADQRGW